MKVKFPNATGDKTCEGLDIIQWSEYYPAEEVERLVNIAKLLPGYDGHLHHLDLKELKAALAPFVEK